MIDLKFDRVSKRYRIRQEAPAVADGASRLKTKFNRLRRLRTQDFWAVRDVSFGVQRGEALGIIGHNGAGKSTILKMLSNITTPTSGTITINGRLAALIEVGSGFHPELSGRENAYLNGSILGMSRREISAKLDRIVEFAGLEKFIDVPVKRYSSGMYVRLGFSIAAHLEPDILLLDEVLAVGDATFQEKCLRRVNELKRAGTTIVFISHDLAAVERLCDRVLLMRSGEVATCGSPRETIVAYQQAAFDSTPAVNQNGRRTGEAEIKAVVLTNPEGKEMTGFCTGFQVCEPFRVRVEYVAHERIPDALFQVQFYAQDDALHCQFTSAFGGERITLDPGRGSIEFSSDELGLQPGLYSLVAEIKHRGTPDYDNIDWRPQCAQLRVDPGRVVHGSFYNPHRWQMLPETDGIGGAYQEEYADRVDTVVQPAG